MKQLLLAVAFIIAANCSFGQDLNKGALFSVHVMNIIDLKPGVTVHQLKTFFSTKVIPAYEQQFQGAKGYLVNGIRGEHAHSVGVLWIFDSEPVRDQYFTAAGDFTDRGKTKMNNLASIEQETEKLATVTDKYTDWVVQ